MLGDVGLQRPHELRLVVVQNCDDVVDRPAPEVRELQLAELVMAQPEWPFTSGGVLIHRSARLKVGLPHPGLVLGIALARACQHLVGVHLVPERAVRAG